MLQKLSLKQLAFFLQICIFISLIISLSSPIIVLKENFPLTLLIDGKIWSINFNELSVFIKSFIILVYFSFSCVCKQQKYACFYLFMLKCYLFMFILYSDYKLNNNDIYCSAILFHEMYLIFFI